MLFEIALASNQAVVQHQLSYSLRLDLSIAAEPATSFAADFRHLRSTIMQHDLGSVLVDAR